MLRVGGLLGDDSDHLARCRIDQDDLLLDHADAEVARLRDQLGQRIGQRLELDRIGDMGADGGAEADRGGAVLSDLGDALVWVTLW